MRDEFVFSTRIPNNSVNAYLVTCNPRATIMCQNHTYYHFTLMHSMTKGKINGSYPEIQICLWKTKAELRKRQRAWQGYLSAWYFRQSRTLGLIFLLLKWCGNLSHYCFQQRGVRVMSIQCSSERFLKVLRLKEKRSMIYLVCKASLY